MKIVETADEFQEIHEIIDRYETLTTNLQDLMEIGKENEDKINAERKQLNKYMEVRYCFLSLYIQIIFNSHV